MNLTRLRAGRCLHEPESTGAVNVPFVRDIQNFLPVARPHRIDLHVVRAVVIPGEGTLRFPPSAALHFRAHRLSPRQRKREIVCCTASTPKQVFSRPVTIAARHSPLRHSSVASFFRLPRPRATIPSHLFGRSHTQRTSHPATNPADSHIQAHPSVAPPPSNPIFAATMILPSSTPIPSSPAPSSNCSVRWSVAANTFRESSRGVEGLSAGEPACAAPHMAKRARK